MRNSYRIGLLVDELAAPRWVHDFATWASEHRAIELVGLIVAPPGSRGAIDRLLKFEQRFFCSAKPYRSYAGSYSVAGLAPATVCKACRKGALESEDLEAIRELELDLIVNCGSRELPRGISIAARDGVISIAAGASCEASASAGFAEVVNGRAETPFTIERLHGAEGAREILFEGSVATALLHSWNHISLQARAFSYLRLVLERMACEELQGRKAPSVQRTREGRASLLSYAVRTAGRSARKAARRALAREFNWQVAFARQGWTDLDFAQGTIIPNPENAFLADPFTIRVGGLDYLFVEEFPFDTRKGVISAYLLEGSEARRIGVVLEEPYHLSFPFLFEHKGEIYMVPEAGAGRTITLYRSTSFPLGWVKEKVLMADVPAVDTIIFEHDSLWWMFTTIQGEGPALNNAELHAFHASDPLGEWTPHRNNPIVMNARKGRNGGFLRDPEGRPCRVAQVPGFTFYGAACEIYRIDELSCETYRESLVREVRPTFFPGLDGSHHVHCGGGLTVYDFMRVERARKGAQKSSLMRSMIAPPAHVETVPKRCPV